MIKNRRFLYAILALLAAGLALFAGCESPMDPSGVKPEEPPPAAGPSIPQSPFADISYVPAAQELDFDRALWSGGKSAAETWRLGGAKTPAAHFGAYKTAVRTIAVGGADGGRVSKAAPGETIGGLKAGPELDVFTVDTSHLPFGGKMEFTLAVTEPGKQTKTVTVYLTVEPGAEAGLYKITEEGAERIDLSAAAGDNVLAKAFNKAYSLTEPNIDYVIMVDGDITVASFIEIRRSNSNASGLSFTLLGRDGERTITLSGTTGSLFKFNYDGATLKLGRNITLRGRENHTAALIDCDNSSVNHVEMLEGAKITGHGFKIFNYGTFTMRGGTITGNTAGLGNPTLIMRGGSITGNMVSTVLYSGNEADISGGEIRGNTHVGTGYYADLDIHTAGNHRLSLSGNPRIGTVMLHASTDAGRSTIVINEGFTGSVDLLHLWCTNAGPAADMYWVKGAASPLLQRGGGFTGPFPVDRFLALGDFYNPEQNVSKEIGDAWYIDRDNGWLSASFVPAEFIEFPSSQLDLGNPFNLNTEGFVLPPEATVKTARWTVTEPGAGLSAGIVEDGILLPTEEGTVGLKAVLEGGAGTAGARTDHAQDFTFTVVRMELTGSVKITGTAQTGQTLTANTTELRGHGEISYQWLRGEGETPIEDAAGSTYVPGDDDLGQAIRLRVTRRYSSGSLTSEPTAAVGNGPYVESVTVSHGTPTLAKSGTVYLDNIAAAVTSGLGAATTVTWSIRSPGETPLRLDGTFPTRITGLAGNKARLFASRYESNDTVIVRAASTFDGSKYGELTVTLTQEPIPGTVAINGTLRDGFTLTAVPSEDMALFAEAGDLEYKWWRGAAHDTAPAVRGMLRDWGVSPDYQLQTADVGNYVWVEVRRGGMTGTAVSADPVNGDDVKAAIVYAGLSVNPASGTVYLGGTQYFYAIDTEQEQAPEAIWSVSGGSGGTAIDQYGRLVIDAGESAESLAITATVGAATVTATVTLSPGPSPARGEGLWIGDSDCIPAYTGDMYGVDIIARSLNFVKKILRNNQEYTVVLGGDLTVAPLNLAAMNAAGKTGVTVALSGAGAERTLSLSGNGTFASVPAGITLALGRDLTVSGGGTNNAALFKVESGGVLDLRTGSKVTGNAGTAANRAVSVGSGGKLLVSGGTLTENTGGAVYVNAGGNMEMTSGSITGNGGGDGGGIYANAAAGAVSAQIRISGGTLSGNGTRDMYTHAGANPTPKSPAWASPVLTLSGNPVIGSVTLFSITPVQGALTVNKITIGVGGFSPASPVDLYFGGVNTNWLNQTVLLKEGGYTDAFPVDRFTVKSGNTINASGQVK